jgi:DHA1 family bicyclomycin/chloramphenicol resistance-like MFS transporter
MTALQITRAPSSRTRTGDPEADNHAMTADAVAQVGEGHEPRHGWRVSAVPSTLMGFASTSANLFLPVLPTIATASRTDAGTIALTYSQLSDRVSLGQPMWGPISDRVGRRGPVRLQQVWCRSSSDRQDVRSRPAQRR